MHTRTIEALEELEAAPWFARVGIHDTKVAIILQSWEEAVAHCESPEWEGLCLEAANRHRERIAERSKERFLRWNQVADEVRAVAIPLVKRKMAEVSQHLELPKAVVDAVRWDIIHLCMESEYADVFPPGFYASQAYWYTKGHFPCGWQGKFPEGMLIIY